METSDIFPSSEIVGIGTATWFQNDWMLNLTLDFPFQSNVKVLFRCKGKKAECPEALGRNVLMLGEKLSDWWNSMALKTNQTIKRKEIEGLEEFRIGELSIRIPKVEITENQKWSLELQTDPYSVFEVSFQGLECIKSKHLEVY